MALTSVSDILDIPEHHEAVRKAVSNLGCDHTIEPESQTASDMFYIAWELFCDGELNEGETEEMLLEEINQWLKVDAS